MDEYTRTAVIPNARLTITNLLDIGQVEEIFRTDVEVIAETDFDLLDVDPTYYSVRMWIPAASGLCNGRPHVKVKGFTETGEQVFAFSHLELDHIAETVYNSGAVPMAQVVWTAHKDRQGNIFAIRNLTNGKVITTNG